MIASKTLFWCIRLYILKEILLVIEYLWPWPHHQWLTLSKAVQWCINMLVLQVISWLIEYLSSQHENSGWLAATLNDWWMSLMNDHHPHPIHCCDASVYKFGMIYHDWLNCYYINTKLPADWFDVQYVKVTDKCPRPCSDARASKF